MTKTNALEALVIAGFVRGLSVRDVEAALAEALGPDAAVSKSAVSRICEEIKAQYEAWRGRFKTQENRQRRGTEGALRCGGRPRPVCLDVTGGAGRPWQHA